jgi:hypothetical protein
VNRYFNVRRYTRMDRGGHFAAVEVGDYLAAEMDGFFRSL